MNDIHIPVSLSPWLSVRNSVAAVAFYKAAFDAIETYRLDMPDGSVVARLSIEEATFWLGEESPTYDNFSPETLGGSTTRMILVVEDPETIFVQALSAGATAVFPVHVEHGWKLGRLEDPFGHHWEIGHPLAD